MQTTLEGLRNAWRLADVRRKLLFTGMILLVYQFAAHVPVIGVDREVLRQILTESEGAGFFNVLNLLSGGAVANFSVLAMGVYPYITASIIFQLLVPIVPQLEALQREPGGQEKLQRYTYYLSVPMAVLQAVAQIAVFSSFTAGGAPLIAGFGSNALVTITVIVTMTAGTMFAVWLGDLITEQGIGNGLSIIIFAGIVASAPGNLANLMTTTTQPVYNLILFILIVLVSVIVIVVIQEGIRRIPVQYGKRVRGRKQYGGASTHIPLRVNPVGMIPLIFAQSIITFPAILANLFPDGGLKTYLTTTFGNQQGFTYWAIFFLLTFGFTFFYAETMIANQNLAENLQRQGGFIPGYRPGKRTHEYILSVSRRITLVGAVFLGLIAIVPGFVDLLNGLLFPTEAVVGQGTLNAANVITGSGLIIVVGVVIDTMQRLEVELRQRKFEGFMR